MEKTERQSKPNQLRISLGLLPIHRNPGESIRDAALRTIMIRPGRVQYIPGEPSPNVWYNKPTLRIGALPRWYNRNDFYDSGGSHE
jgi:hypothetical protein